MMAELHMSREVALLGVSLYVLGFGLGYGTLDNCGFCPC